MERCKITQEVMGREQEMEERIQNMERKEEEKWRIKSHSLWLKDGDKNTKYFHNQYKERMRKNTIKELYIERG